MKKALLPLLLATTFVGAAGAAETARYVYRGKPAEIVQPAPPEPEGYEFESHRFTTCGASGWAGPTLEQCRAAYASTEWAADDRLFSMGMRGFQTWMAPESGVFEIVAKGASGNAGAATGGYPASITGRVDLKVGERLMLVVGQRGTVAGSGQPSAAGGGGGTFVIGSGGELLVAAGGGGGFARSNQYQSASNGTVHALPAEANGRTAPDHGGTGSCGPHANVPGGVDGLGGTGSCGGGGAGFKGAGGHSFAVYMSSAGGQAIMDGAEGGKSYNGAANQAHGGFGGGGAGIASIGPGGGGGGYSGGAGGGYMVLNGGRTAQMSGGGAGGSFAGSRLVNVARAATYENTDGYVQIRRVD